MLIRNNTPAFYCVQEDFREKCILEKESDISGDKGVISVVFFRMNFKNNT